MSQVVVIYARQRCIIGTYIQWNISHKKERNWVICRDMDGPRDCHTE